jgi:hypothetical protein
VGIAPAKDVTAMPDLSAELDVRPTCLLPQFPLGRGLDVLTRLKPTAGRKPEDNPGRRVHRAEKKHAIVIIDDEHTHRVANPGSDPFGSTFYAIAIVSAGGSRRVVKVAVLATGASGHVKPES